MPTASVDLAPVNYHLQDHQSADFPGHFEKPVADIECIRKERHPPNGGRESQKNARSARGRSSIKKPRAGSAWVGAVLELLVPGGSGGSAYSLSDPNGFRRKSGRSRLARHPSRGVNRSSFLGNRLVIEDPIFIAVAASAAHSGTVTAHTSPIASGRRATDKISATVAGIVAIGRIAVKVAPVAFAAGWSAPGVAIEDRKDKAQGAASRSIAASAAAARSAARIVTVVARIAARGGTFVGLILKVAWQHGGVAITRVVRIRP